MNAAASAGAVQRAGKGDWIMARVLHVQASPRGAESFSRRAAEQFIEAYLESHPGAEIDVLDVFADALPRFDAPAAKAKYSVLAGQEPADDAARAWKAVIDVVDRLKAADLVLISSAMWNFSIPYRLKQWVDVIVQPALSFSYSPQEGYKGLITGKPAVLILARGGDYSPGSGYEAFDFQKPYLESILGLIGFESIRTIIVQPTLQGGPDVGRQKLDRALAEAAELATSL
jgi:FMN-dependent NADH-azoreductase